MLAMLKTKFVIGSQLLLVKGKNYQSTLATKKLKLAKMLRAGCFGVRFADLSNLGLHFFLAL